MKWMATSDLNRLADLEQKSAPFASFNPFVFDII